MPIGSVCVLTGRTYVTGEVGGTRSGLTNGSLLQIVQINHVKIIELDVTKLLTWILRAIQISRITLNYNLLHRSKVHCMSLARLSLLSENSGAAT